MIKQSIVKANDIRGIVTGDSPEWDLDGARAFGAAFVELAGLRGKSFVLGRDMRVMGAELSSAFAEAAAAQGANVIDIGLSSTDQLWFASGELDLPGVQFTASHNPSNYNGIKFCRASAAPVDPDFLPRMGELASRWDRDGIPATDTAGGQISKQDMLEPYGAYLRGLVNLDGIRPLKVVVDAGNGMAGHTVHSVFQGLDIDLVGLYLELDGTFPNHPANPLEPENLVDAQRTVVESGADLALVFDGDADRCFIIDETGAVVTPSSTTAMIAAAELDKEPGSSIVMNKITSLTVAEVVAEKGGTLVVSRVGHTYMKAVMAEVGAIFGGEHSAHYYFRDFWNADTGMLAALHVIAQLGRSGLKLSELVEQFDRYAASGEINFASSDVQAAMASVADSLGERGEVDYDDGLTIAGDDPERGAWWVNVRPSNTEPLLRLNVEARDPDLMESLRDDVSSILSEDS